MYLAVGDLVGWQACIDGIYTPPPPSGQSCPSTNPFRPGGFVKVQDTEFVGDSSVETMRGVRRIKVILKDNWFTEDEVWTNDDGCFKVNETYKGKLWMWVKFTGDRCKIRGVPNGATGYYEFIKPIKDYIGTVNGAPFNNIEVNYFTYDEVGSKGHIRWGASTVNNALHEFHDFAAADGISPPPYNLDIFVSKSTDFGYALMTKKIGPGPVTSAVTSGLAAGSLDWFDALIFNGEIGAIAGALGIAPVISIFFPDVHVGIDLNNNFALRFSDDLKQLAYHEIAHASQHAHLGDFYWLKVIEAEVAANGWGDGSENEAGRVALVESWADFIGTTYAHRTYGDNNSVPGNWNTQLERTWNEVPNHVPIGLHHDLVDAAIGSEVPNPCDADVMNGIPNCTTMIDNVDGFTISQLFSSLNSDVKNPGQYFDELIDNHLGSTTNTQAEVGQLFLNY